jgi:hypothetical protein
MKKWETASDSDGTPTAAERISDKRLYGSVKSCGLEEARKAAVWSSQASSNGLDG